MPPMIPNAWPRLAALAIDFAKTQVIAALSTRTQRPGGAPASDFPAKNWAAELRFGANPQTKTQ